MLAKEALKSFSWFWVVIALALFFIFSATLFFVHYLTAPAELERNHQLWGACILLVLGLFACGMIGIWLSVKMQFLAILRMQKKMQAQHKMLQRQKSNLQGQTKLARIQYFESSFFNLLTNFDSLRVNFTIKDTIYNKEGKLEQLSFFPFIAGVYGNCTQGASYGLSMQTIYPKGEPYIAFPTRTKWIGKIFSKHINIDKLRNYFLYLHNIIRFIDTHNTFVEAHLIDEPMDVEQMKAHYLDIVLASLSQTELLLLFYNSLNYGKMKPLIEKYHMLKNLNLSSLPSNLDVCLYHKTAFSDGNSYQHFDAFTKTIVVGFSGNNQTLYDFIEQAENEEHMRYAECLHIAKYSHNATPVSEKEHLQENEVLRKNEELCKAELSHKIKLSPKNELLHKDELLRKEDLLHKEGHLRRESDYSQVG